MVHLYYSEFFNIIFLILITVSDVGGTYIIIFVVQIIHILFLFYKLGNLGLEKLSKDLLKVTCLSGKTVIKIRAQISQLIVQLVLFLLYYF